MRSKQKLNQWLRYFSFLNTVHTLFDQLFVSLICYSVTITLPLDQSSIFNRYYCVIRVQFANIDHFLWLDLEYFPSNSVISDIIH